MYIVNTLTKRGKNGSNSLVPSILPLYPGSRGPFSTFLQYIFIIFNENKYRYTLLLTNYYIHLLGIFYCFLTF